MIIKSMSRKQATFGQLVDYMEDGRQDKRFTLKHNLYSNKAEEIKKEFEENAKFIRKRRNGVYMYHEVLSVTKSTKINEDKQKEILREIALRYIEKRANNNLIYAVLHDDKSDNFHYHFIISSNEIEATKKHRLSKYEFDTLKKDLEKWVLEKYPELEQKEIINKQSKDKLSSKGAELKRRTGKTSQRDSVINRLKTVFSSSQDKQSFFENIEKENLEIYVRKNTIGVIDKNTGRNHRLKTLGMLVEFNKISKIVEKSDKVKNDKKSRQEDLHENRKPYKEKVSVKNNTYTVDEDLKYESVDKNRDDSFSKEEIEINKRKEYIRKSRELSESERTKKDSKTRNR